MYCSYHDAPTKKDFSPSLGATLAIFTKSSATSNLNLSAVAGESSVNDSNIPLDALALLSASRSANRTLDPKNSGGSPIPLLLWMDRIFSHDTPCRKLTLNDCGMSPKPGIL